MYKAPVTTTSILIDRAIQVEPAGQFAQTASIDSFVLAKSAKLIYPRPDY